MSNSELVANCLRISLGFLLHFAKLAKLAMSNSELVANCLRISLGFLLQQQFSLATVFSEFGKCVANLAMALANLAMLKFR